MSSVTKSHIRGNRYVVAWHACYTLYIGIATPAAHPQNISAFDLPHECINALGLASGVLNPCRSRTTHLEYGYDDRA